MAPRHNQGRSHRAKEPGFIARHLMGEYPLGRSFWLHTMAVGWGLNLLVGAISTHLSEQYALRYAAMFVLAVHGFVIGVWLWSNFGTWIAAFKRLFAREGRLWGLVAILALSVGAIGMMRHLASLKPFLVEHWEVAMGRQPTDGFTVTVLPRGDAILFEGGINEGAARALKDKLVVSPGVRAVWLNSPGGWMHEGERMAEVIKLRGLDTHATGACMSACTVVFLAGRERTAERHAQIGFHSGHALGEGKTTRSPAAGRHDEVLVYRKAGLDDAFIRRILNTPFESMWVPSRAELLASRVLTR